MEKMKNGPRTNHRKQLPIVPIGLCVVIFVVFYKYWNASTNYILMKKDNQRLQDTLRSNAHSHMIKFDDMKTSRDGKIQLLLANITSLQHKLGVNSKLLIESRENFANCNDVIEQNKNDKTRMQQELHQSLTKEQNIRSNCIEEQDTLKNECINKEKEYQRACELEKQTLKIQNTKNINSPDVNRNVPKDDNEKINKSDNPNNDNNNEDIKIRQDNNLEKDEVKNKDDEEEKTDKNEGHDTNDENDKKSMYYKEGEKRNIGKEDRKKKNGEELSPDRNDRDPIKTAEEVIKEDNANLATRANKGADNGADNEDDHSKPRFNALGDPTEITILSTGPSQKTKQRFQDQAAEVENHENLEHQFKHNNKAPIAKSQTNKQGDDQKVHSNAVGIGGSVAEKTVENIGKTGHIKTSDNLDENKDGAAENKDGAAENKDDAAENKDGAAENKDGAAKNKVGAEENKDGEAENKDGAAENKDEAAENKDGAAENKDEVAENKGEVAENKNGASENKDGAAENKDGAAENKDGAAENKDGEAENKDGAAENKDGAAENKDEENTENKDTGIGKIGKPNIQGGEIGDLGHNIQEKTLKEEVDTRKEIIHSNILGAENAETEHDGDSIDEFNRASRIAPAVGKVSPNVEDVHPAIANNAKMADNYIGKNEDDEITV